MARDALIGTGLVGMSLLARRNFDEIYNTANIDSIKGQFDTVYCAAMPGTKWSANAEPEKDRQTLHSLLKNLLKVKAERFILVSTVDVFAQPAIGDELTMPQPDTTYGLNRLILEKFVQSHFPKHLIVRLPNVFSPLMRKGPLYDIKHKHRVECLSRESIYQWYRVSELPNHCELLWSSGVRLAHLTSKPISLKDMYKNWFFFMDDWMMKGKPVHYDISTIRTDLKYYADCPTSEIIDYIL